MLAALQLEPSPELNVMALTAVAMDGLEATDHRDRLDFTVQNLATHCAQGGITAGMIPEFLMDWAQSFLEACPAPATEPTAQAAIADNDDDDDADDVPPASAETGTQAVETEDTVMANPVADDPLPALGSSSRTTSAPTKSARQVRSGEPLPMVDSAAKGEKSKGKKPAAKRVVPDSDQDEEDEPEEEEEQDPHDEYHEPEETSGEGSAEDDKEDEEDEDDKEEEDTIVKGPAHKVVARAGKRKGAASGVGERESIGHSKIGDLPKNICMLVSSAQNQLHLIIALKTAWSKEPTVPSAHLPSSDNLIVIALREPIKHSKGKPNAHAIVSGFQLLQDDKVEGYEELDILHKKAYTVVWSCASQTWNKLKKKARVVMEKLLALWLLETHETEVTDGTGMCNIPNFIFGSIELVYKQDKSLDTKRSKVDPLQPFKSLAIPEVIYQYWGLTCRWRTKGDEVVGERQQEKLCANPPAAAQEGEGVQWRATQAGGSTASIAAAKSNVAAVAGSSCIAAMSSEHDRNEDKDMQEESPELDELESDDSTSGGEPEPSDVE
ncbi:hypothetical protein C8Q72DRAFT_909803 [Fomitopsis betulina]|nr:hypothetical protein C8Q72DRAFT_909803 [Fomitopsis betulina]